MGREGELTVQCQAKEDGVGFVIQPLFAESEVHLLLLVVLLQVEREGGIAALILAEADFPVGASVLNNIKSRLNSGSSELEGPVSNDSSSNVVREEANFGAGGGPLDEKVEVVAVTQPEDRGGHRALGRPSLNTRRRLRVFF